MSKILMGNNILDIDRDGIGVAMVSCDLIGGIDGRAPLGEEIWKLGNKDIKGGKVGIEMLGEN